MEDGLRYLSRHALRRGLEAGNPVLPTGKAGVETMKDVGMTMAPSTLAKQNQAWVMISIRLLRLRRRISDDDGGSPMTSMLIEKGGKKNSSGDGWSRL
jgi:hypothetical protein